MVHKRWIKPVPPSTDEPPLLDYDVAYVAEIMAYYHSHNTVPNLLPENYKGYLLDVGLATTLTNCDEEYVVFSKAGGEVARAANRNTHNRGKGRKSA